MDLLPNNLSDQDKWLLAASTAGLLGDWSQTHDLQTNRRHELHEANPILGENPHRKDINAYFGTAILGNYLLGNNLPQKQRQALWGTLAAIQAANMLNNHRLGMRFSFDIK